jgi:hypothetical protein
MSAYIVDKQHIQYLIDAAMQSASCGAFRWYHGGEWRELPKGDKERAAEIANMLWCENIKSVSHRYPHESSATLPGPTETETIEPRDFHGIRWLHFVPVQVAKACDCYDYQSCEHDEWETSEAKAFTDSLKESQWRRLPGYDDAEWGAPEVYANAHNVVSLSELAASAKRR